MSQMTQNSTYQSKLSMYICIYYDCCRKDTVDFDQTCPKEVGRDCYRMQVENYSIPWHCTIFDDSAVVGGYIEVHGTTSS